MTSSADIWTVLLAIAERRRAGSLPADGFRCGLDDDRLVCEPLGIDRLSASDALVISDGRTCSPGPAMSCAERTLAEPLLPLLDARPGQAVVVAHLGQSIDGCIATRSGHSSVVTGPADFEHMHRLRALADAIVVGGGTVAADDPQLTTRSVEGPDPVRVIIDPAARLDASYGVFTDGESKTLHVIGNDLPAPSDARFSRGYESMRLPRDDHGAIDPAAVLDNLVARGLCAIFVEGGGVTVTRWLEAGLLDRLQIAVAPVIIGAGRPGLQLPSALTMKESLRPPCTLHRLGDDVLWDFNLACSDQTRRS